MGEKASSQETDKSESMGHEEEQLVEVEEEDEEAEYVLLDLDNIAEHISIPPNTPYVLSGLDTLNPILTIDSKTKLIGEYEETIGTCFVFNESDADADPSEGGMDPKETATKQVNPMTSLNRVLKFRLLFDADGEDKQTNNPSS